MILYSGNGNSTIIIRKALSLCDKWSINVKADVMIDGLNSVIDFSLIQGGIMHISEHLFDVIVCINLEVSHWCTYYSYGLGLRSELTMVSDCLSSARYPGWFCNDFNTYREYCFQVSMNRNGLDIKEYNLSHTFCGSSKDVQYIL